MTTTALTPRPVISAAAPGHGVADIAENRRARERPDGFVEEHQGGLEVADQAFPVPVAPPGRSPVPLARPKRPGDENEAFPPGEGDAARGQGDVDGAPVAPPEDGLLGAQAGRLLDPHGRVRGQDLVEVEQTEPVLGDVEQGEHGRVGEGRAAIEDHQGPLGRRLDEGPVLLVGFPEFVLGLGPAALEAHALGRHEEEQKGAEDGDADGDADQARGHGPDLGLDVLDVEPGTEDPAPGRVLLDIGLLGLEAVRVVLPLPDVFDVGVVAVAQGVGELDEDADAARVLEVGDVTAVQVGPVGVHDHPDVEVGDPEVVLALVAVAEVADTLGRGPLRFFERHPARAGVGVVFGQDARGDVGQLPDGVSLALEEPLLEGGDEDPEEENDEERDGQGRRQEDPHQEGSSARAGHRPLAAGLAGK